MRAGVAMMVFVALMTARATAGHGLPIDSESVMIRVTFYNGTSITCRAVDERRSVSGRPYRMRDVQAVSLPAHQTGTVRLRSGEVMSLPEAGFDHVDAWLGTQRLVLECLNVTSFEVLNGARAPRDGRADAPTAAAAPEVGASPADNPPEARTIRLPAPADNVVAAGSGRYLLLHLKKLRKLAVFDARTGAVAKFLPVGAESAYVAGGATKFVVVLPDQNVIQRWDLTTLERELSLPLPEGDAVDGAVMGYGSAGPLLLMRRDGPQFLDVRTLKPLALALPGGNAGNWRPHPQYPLAVRASADGSTFAAWEPGLSPAGIRTLSIRGTTLSARYEHTSAGELLPALDGSLLFTSGGVFSADLKPVAADTFRNVVCLPTYSPAYFLGVRLGDGFMRNNASGGPKLTVYSTSDRATLVTLPALPEFSGLDRQKVMFAGGLSLSQRIHLMPASRLLVTIPDTRDAVIVRSFDLVQELDKSGTDYLFVSSMPVPSAARGSTYTYPVEVRSKHGGVKYKLESGPAGMTLAVNGKLEWKVPLTFSDDQASVIVTVSDASGQEVYHSFNIALEPNDSAAASGREP